MNREQAKELLPIMQAFAEGKTIQFKWPNGTWVDVEKGCDINFTSLIRYPQDYRIKQEPKYRPFKNAQECWEEIQKHQPFGWVKYKEVTKSLITEVSSICVKIGKNYYFQEAKEVFTFADGTPFGIKDA